MSKVACVLRIDPRSSRLRAAGKTEQQIANAFQANHEFHASQQFASFGSAHLRNRKRDPIVDFPVQRIEFLLPFSNGIKQWRRASRDSFSSSRSGILGDGT